MYLVVIKILPHVRKNHITHKSKNLQNHKSSILWNVNRYDFENAEREKPRHEENKKIKKASMLAITEIISAFSLIRGAFGEQEKRCMQRTLFPPSPDAIINGKM